jgi:rod shape-determining protein MreD
MKKFTVPVLLFFFLGVVQVALIPLISFGNIYPNLILIIVVFYGVREGKIFGALLGFLLGFLFDILSGGLIGSSMFAFTLGGFIAGYYYREDDYSNLYSFNFLFILLLAGTFSSFAYALLVYSDVSSNFLTLFFVNGLLPAFYTMIFGLPVLFLKPKDTLR